MSKRSNNLENLKQQYDDVCFKIQKLQVQKRGIEKSIKKILKDQKDVSTQASKTSKLEL